MQTEPNEVTGETVTETSGGTVSNDTGNSPETTQTPPATTTEQEDLDNLLITVAEKYTDPTSRRVRWGQAEAENPDIFDRLKQGKDMKALIDRYGNFRRKAPGFKPLQRRLKRTDKPVMAVWSKAEIASVMAIGRVLKNRSTGSVEWAKAKSMPEMKSLMKNHTFKEITSRWYYEHYKTNKPKNPTSNVKKLGKGGRDLEKQKLYNAKYRAKMKKAAKVELEPKGELPATVTQVVPMPANCEVVFCPYCGHNIQGVIAADRIMQRDR